MSDWKIFIPVLVVLLSGAGWTITTLFQTVKSESKLEAKEELRKEFEHKYEGVTTELITVRTDYAVLKEVCGN